MNALGVFVLSLREVAHALLCLLRGVAVCAVLGLPWLAQAVFELCVDPWLAARRAGQVECVQVQEVVR